MTTTTLARRATKLPELRAEIDAIDDDILALVARRVALAAPVRAIKPQGRHPFRPAREEALLARLGKDVSVPPALIERVWRALIGAGLFAQGLTEVVVEDAALAPAAAARFGGQVPVRVGDARAAAALGATVGAVAFVGDLPEGVRVLAPLDAEDGTALGWIIGREDEA